MKKVLVVILICVLVVYSGLATFAAGSFAVENSDLYAENEERLALIKEQQELLNTMSDQLGDLAYGKGSVRGCAFELLFEKMWYGDGYDITTEVITKAIKQDVGYKEVLEMADDLLDEYIAERK